MGRTYGIAGKEDGSDENKEDKEERHRNGRPADQADEGSSAPAWGDIVCVDGAVEETRGAQPPIQPGWPWIGRV